MIDSPLGSQPPDPNATTRPGLRQALRTQTAAAHQRLDGRFDGMEAASSPALYEEFLLVNHACHEEIEPVLAASPVVDVVADWSARGRLASLEADLARMGLRPLRLAAFPIDRPSLPEAVGIAYVLEGSRLGARFIRRKFEADGVPDGWPDMSDAFLRQAGEPERFRSFIAAISELRFCDVETNLAVGAANRTFDYFLAAAELAGASRRLVLGAA